MDVITKVHARQILDSRGNPTIEVDVHTRFGFMGRASVPSGASTGAHEAWELRDEDPSIYMGRSVQKAIAYINELLGKCLLNLDVTEQALIDRTMIDKDGTKNKSKYGANALLGISLAVARAGALSQRESLFIYLSKKFQLKEPLLLPTPLMNIINGGIHASNNLDIQEFMILPHIQGSFSTNLRAGVEIFQHLKQILLDANHSINVGDEGGFAPQLKSHEEALDSILAAIRRAKFEPGKDVSIALDIAASTFYKDGVYRMQGKNYSSLEMIHYYKNLLKTYPIYSIEDGLDENDFQGWTALTKELGNKIKIVGDDLFVTHKERLREGIKKKQANSILIKLNQIGTLTETYETIKLAYEHHFTCIISHRSGETADSFIADLAVAVAAGHIKTGSASRTDRTEKYNQLLRIEETLGSKALYKCAKNTP